MTSSLVGLDESEQKVVTVKTELFITINPDQIINRSIDVMNYLKKEYNTSLLTKDGKIIKANRSLLCGYSELFKKMINGSGDIKEPDPTNLTIEKYDCDVLQLLIDYVHDEKIHVNHNLIIPLMECSHYFEINHLYILLKILIQAVFSNTNIFGFYKKSTEYGLDDMAKICETHLYQNLNSTELICSIESVTDMKNIINIAEERYEKYTKYALFSIIVIFIEFKNIEKKNNVQLKPFEVQELISLIIFYQFTLEQIMAVEDNPCQSKYLSSDTIRKVYKYKLKNLIKVGDILSGKKLKDIGLKYDSDTKYGSIIPTFGLISLK